MGCIFDFNFNIQLISNYQEGEELFIGLYLYYNRIWATIGQIITNNNLHLILTINYWFIISVYRSNVELELIE